MFVLITICNCVLILTVYRWKVSVKAEFVHEINCRYRKVNVMDRLGFFSLFFFQKYLHEN